MTLKPLVALFILCIVALTTHVAAGPAESADSLMKRILPASAGSFTYTVIPMDSGRDVFEIAGSGGSVIVRGSSTSAICMGLGYYLKHSCNVHFSLTGNQTTMPASLPSVNTRIVIPCKYRYVLNYCTYNYSFSFWHWNQWECRRLRPKPSTLVPCILK